jgi:potassium efflux system protein
MFPPSRAGLNRRLPNLLVLAVALSLPASIATAQLPENQLQERTEPTDAPSTDRVDSGAPTAAISPTEVIDVPDLTEPLVAPDQAASAAERERTELARARRALEVYRDLQRKRLRNLESTPVDRRAIEQAQVEVSGVRLRGEDLELQLEALDRVVREREERVAELESQRQLLLNPTNLPGPGVDRQIELARLGKDISELKAAEGVTRSHRELIAAQIELNQSKAEMAEEWLRKVTEVASLQEERAKAESQRDVQQRLEDEAQGHANEAARLRARLLEPELGTEERARLEITATAAEERATLTRIDARLANVNDRLRIIGELIGPERAPAASDVRAAMNELARVATSIDSARDLAARKAQLVDSDRRLVRERLSDLPESIRDRLLKDLEDLDRVYRSLGLRVAQLGDTQSRILTLADSLELIYEEAVRRGLLQREQLPSNEAELRTLGSALVRAPQALLFQLWVSFGLTLESIAEANTTRWLSLIAIELALLWLVIVLCRQLDRLLRVLSIRARRRDRFSDSVLLLFLRLLRSNIAFFGILVGIALVAVFAGVQQPARGILVALGIILLVFKPLVTLNWLLVGDRNLPEKLYRPRLFWETSLTAIAAALVLGMVVTARQAALPDEVVGLFDRLLMLVLLVGSLPALRLRAFILDLVRHAYSGRRWFPVAAAVSLLAVLALGIAGVVGLAGYINLAIEICRSLGLLIALMIAWMLLGGLLEDVVVWAKNFAVGHFKVGLLWTQDIIPPLHRIARLLLAGLVFYLFLGMLGWEVAEFAGERLFGVLRATLFSVGETEITLWIVLVVLFSTWAVIAFARWLRNITYRWVYSRITDLGVRHSLSVFTQYAAVVVGLLLVLNLSGIDLTTLTVFAGALGVGIGFGLQAIANNFISGILLLAERPLRTGDLVQVSGSEGTVTRIGMRSLTIETFDNQEVIIPNSDVISNAFTNWTHSNNILRTVLMVRVSYRADPHLVQRLIGEALKNHPDVLEEPEFLVLLWTFGENGMDFRIQYFLDVVASNLLKLRSEVMFDVWDTLKKHGIEVPLPQRDLYIKEVPPEELPRPPGD